MNDLNGTNDVGSLRLDEYVVRSIVNKTYSDLLETKSNGNLIPGQRYCITDYADGLSVLVDAISANAFNEMAYAIDANGSCYDIKYCIENDAMKFSLDLDNSEKGVIYWMKDSRCNEAPFNFLQHQVFGQSSAGNTILPYFEDGVQAYNNIAIDGNAYGNTFGFGCHDIVLDGDFSHNVFENGCYGLTCTVGENGGTCQYVQFKSGVCNTSIVVGSSQTIPTMYQPTNVLLKSI